MHGMLSRVTGEKLLCKRNEIRRNRAALVALINIFSTFIYWRGLKYFNILGFIPSIPLSVFNKCTGKHSRFYNWGFWEMKAYALRSARGQGSTSSVTLQKPQVAAVQSNGTITSRPARRGGRRAQWWSGLCLYWHQKADVSNSCCSQHRRLRH